jgi:hypothetical protein
MKIALCNCLLMLNFAPTPEDPASESSPDASARRAERRLRLLEEMSEIGMELLRGLKPSAAADEAADEAADRVKGRDPADAFARLSRAIRLTLTLEAKTDTQLWDLRAGIVRMREEEQTQAAKQAVIDSEARTERLRNLVARVAEAEIPDIEDLNRLDEALEERLYEDEAYYDCTERPLRETVERLCKDLDLNPDWSRWGDEGWIVDGPPARPLSSEFHHPSRKPLMVFDHPPPGAEPRPGRLQPARNLE